HVIPARDRHEPAVERRRRVVGVVLQLVRALQLGLAIERLAERGGGEHQAGNGRGTGRAEAARDRDVRRRVNEAGRGLDAACPQSCAECVHQDVVVGVGLDGAERTAALDAQRHVVRQVACVQPSLEGESVVVEAGTEIGSAARYADGRSVQRVSGQSSSRIWSACSSGFTFGSTCATRPSSSMMNVVRSLPQNFFPYIDFSFHTPYASATSWSSSARSVKGRLYFSRNFWWLLTESGLTPRTRAPVFSMSPIRSRRPHACFVHPGVSSLG